MRLLIRHLLMAGVWSVFTVGTPAFSQTWLEGLPAGKPRAVLADRQDRLYLDYGGKVAVIGQKLDRVVELPPRVDNFQPDEFHTGVTATGEIISLAPGYDYFYTFVGSGQKSIPTLSKKVAKLMLYRCTQTCAPTPLADRFLDDSGVITSPRGGVFFKTYKNTVAVQKASGQQGPLQTQREFQFYFNGEEVPAEKFNAQWEAHFAPGVAIGPQGEWMAEGQPWPETAPSRKNSPAALAWDNQANPHLFYQEPADGTLMHRTAAHPGGEAALILLDGRESGGAVAALTLGGSLWVVHTFRRDNRNKGLAATQVGADGKPVRHLVLDGSQTSRFPGFEVVAGGSGSRAVISYLSDPQAGKRETILFTGSGQLETLAANLSRYASPKGAGSPVEERDKDPAQLGGELSAAYDAPYQPLVLSPGAGMGVRMWSFAKQDGAAYKTNTALLLSAGLSGRVEDFSFGVSGTTQGAELGKETTGTHTAYGYQGADGAIGFQHLFGEYDLNLGLGVNSFPIYMDTGTAFDSKLYTRNTMEGRLEIASPNRHRFGLMFRRYNHFQQVTHYKRANN
ncbi:MAG: hypothetical protein OEW12_09270, partial [Deltaproteobacteria bacterium]|nr:hypothetical protein [Deltaproteobacteria bacterium]